MMRLMFILISLNLFSNSKLCYETIKPHLELAGCIGDLYKDKFIWQGLQSPELKDQYKNKNILKTPLFVSDGFFNSNLPLKEYLPNLFINKTEISSATNSQTLFIPNKEKVKCKVQLKRTGSKLQSISILRSEIRSQSIKHFTLGWYKGECVPSNFTHETIRERTDDTESSQHSTHLISCYKTMNEFEGGSNGKIGFQEALTDAFVNLDIIKEVVDSTFEKLKFSLKENDSSKLNATCRPSIFTKELKKVSPQSYNNMISIYKNYCACKEVFKDDTKLSKSLTKFSKPLLEITPIKKVSTGVKSVSQR